MLRRSLPLLPIITGDHHGRRVSGRARHASGQPCPADLVGQAVRPRGLPQASPHGAAVRLWTLEWVVRGYVGIHRAQKATQVDGCRPRRMSLHRFPLALSYPEPLRVTGPLPSQCVLSV